MGPGGGRGSSVGAGVAAEAAAGAGAACPAFAVTARTSLFYAEGKDRHGPYRPAELAGLVRAGRVTGETRVWCKAMGDRSASPHPLHRTLGYQRPGPHSPQLLPFPP